MALPASVWWILGLGGALAVAGIARADTKPRRKTRAKIGPAGKRGLGDLMRLMERAQTPPDWQVFFAAVAHHESRWNSSAWNQASSEVAASARAYDRNKDRYSHCPWPASAYKIGSGGWFGLIPANALAAFWDTQLHCLSPNSIFDPVPSFAMAVDYARRLQRWGQFQVNPTWLNLNRGWKAPSNMGSVVPGSDAALREALAALRSRGWDIPSGWENRAATPLPLPSAAEIYFELGGDES